MTWAFYTRYALRALGRGGQRTLLALVCVAFGVLSLVAMQLLAGMVHATVVVDARAAIGGDAVVSPQGPEGAQVFTSADLATLTGMQARGVLTGVCTMAAQDFRALQPPAGGGVYLLSQQPTGLDPAHCPLAGTAPVAAPAGMSLAAALAAPAGAVLTRDLAGHFGLQPGDRITMLGSGSAPRATLTVTAILADTPDHTGDHIFYSVDTARRLAGTPDVITQASVAFPAGSAAVAQLKAANWHVITADQVAANGGGCVGQVFDFMLKGAGILGLIVGGIGVANTLQVSLARRMLEIAMLKTVGYQRRDLLALFGIETALLGLAGGLIGAVAGVGVAAGLGGLLEQSGIFLLHWSVDPWLVAGGVAAGVVTAVIFGLFTIVQASAVRPAVLLRQQGGRRSLGTRLAGGGLLLALGAVFTAISSLVMGGPLAGAEIVGAAVAGLIGFAILLGTILFVLLRLPLPEPPLLRLARQNLKRRPLRVLFPLIALFMGVFSIGFSGGTILNAVQRVNSLRTANNAVDLMIYTRQADAAQVAQELAAVGVPAHAGTSVPLATVQGPAGRLAAGPVFLDGRAAGDLGWDAKITAGALPAGPDEALVPDTITSGAPALAVGDPLTVVTAAGQTLHLRVSGIYQSQVTDLLYGTEPGIQVTLATVAPLTGPDAAVTYMAAVAPSALPGVEARLSAALPGAALVSTTDMNDALSRRFAGLLNFVVGVAGLALVAGTILIANGVGLALIERRRELGILKAVGFSAGRVLATLLLENALLGLLAGVLGMIAVAGAMAFINLQRPAAQLALDPWMAAGMVALSAALALGVTVLVAWQPTHVRPLEVLREE